MLLKNKDKKTQQHIKYHGLNNKYKSKNSCFQRTMTKTLNNISHIMNLTNNKSKSKNNHAFNEQWQKTQQHIKYNGFK